MPKMGKNILNQIKNMPAGKPKEILRACFMRKKGMSLREIAEQLEVPFSTIRGWLVRVMKRGMNGIYDKKSPGRKRMLGPQVLGKIKERMDKDPVECGFQSASWSMDLIVGMVEKIAGSCMCSGRTLQRALRRLGYSYSKPRPIPYQSATPEEQEKFKKEVKEEITRLARLGYAIFAADETGITRGSAAGYGWRPTNGGSTVCVGFQTKSVKFFGALKDGKIHVRYSEKLNSETFTDFLKELLEIYVRFVMILDNASYHTSAEVNDFIESTHGNVKLIFLPSHTPQINPIETQWAVLKKLVAGRYFKTAEDLADAVDTLIETNEMKPVKLMSYLVPDEP